MKYYLNLIKRKRIKEVLTYIAVMLLCFIFFIGGIKSKNSDGIIVSIFSLIFMYMACVYTPMTNPNAQDDSDFEVKSIGDEIYIKYKNYEYLLGKENFRVSDLFF